MKYGFFLVHSPSVVWSLVRIPALEYIKQKRECSVQETQHTPSILYKLYQISTPVACHSITSVYFISVSDPSSQNYLSRY